jgi:tRNA dimethylallyltransferase
LEKTDPHPGIACIALEESRAVLITKIGQRVDAMFEQGVVAEVAAVEAIGSTASRAIGFQLIRSLLAGNIDFSTCSEAIKQQTRSYAKRQMTWFRRSRYQLVPADSSADLVIEAFQRQIQEAPAQVGGRSSG